MRNILLVIGLAVILAGCTGSGLDEETKAAIRSTLDSLRDLADRTDSLLAPTVEPAGEPTPELTLKETGAFASSSRATTAIVNGRVQQVTEQVIQLSGWGYWGKAREDTLFRAALTARGSITNGVPNMSYSSAVIGTRSASNPISGSVTWTGGVRGVTEDFTQIEGYSRVEIDFDNTQVHVDFTDFGSSDMWWYRLPLANGSFFKGTELRGSFYGDDHEGVAGVFDRDGIRGVFGALRD